MQVNWFTVLAQVLNFFILVWLLKRFLYKPILDAIDARENKIKAQLESAEAQKAEAQKEQADFKQKNETFDNDKKALMDKVVAETNEERQKQLEEVRNEANTLKLKLDKALKESQENLKSSIEQKTKQAVLNLTRKTLSEMASTSLEEQATLVFIKKLKHLTKEEMQGLMAAFKSDTNPILVRSAFELPDKEKAAIKQAVTDILGANTSFQFEQKQELISGIELTTNGYKLAWSISEYVNSLEKNVSETT